MSKLTREFVVVADESFSTDGMFEPTKQRVTGNTRRSLFRLAAFRREFHEQGVDEGFRPIGQAFIDFLEACSVASVWKSYGSWEGSAAAIAAGLTGSVAQSVNSSNVHPAGESIEQLASANPK